MEKHFCDVCNQELSNNKVAVSLSLQRRYSPNEFLKVEEMCDDCCNEINLAINEVMNKIILRRKQ